MHAWPPVQRWILYLLFNILAKPGYLGSSPLREEKIPVIFGSGPPVQRCKGKDNKARLSTLGLLYSSSSNQ